MKTSGVGIWGATPNLTLATKGHPNSIKTLNPISIDTGSISHSKLVPFIIASALIVPTTTRTSSTIATTIRGTVPFFLILSLVLIDTILITRFSTTIEAMVSTTIEACIDPTMNNPFVGGCKVVVEIIGIAKNTLILEMVSSEEEEP
jgi:hypothetical protein